MDLLSQILEQVPNTKSPHFLELRKILLQIDRESARKKSIAGLTRLSQTLESGLKPYVYSGLAMAHFLDNDYSKALYWIKETITRHPLSPLALYCATMMVLIYQMLGMKRERFEAEGSRFLIMKKIAMQSEDPNHRIIALYELKKELEARDLHEEALRCDQELDYWFSLLRKRSSSRAYANKTYLRP